MPTLFISYKRGDSAVEPIVQALRDAKYRTWFDKENILTGTAWRNSIERGIEQSAAIVAVLNQEATESPYVLEELNLARTMNKPIFPVITQENAKKQLGKLGLEEIQYVDLTQTGYWKETIQQLVGHLVQNGIKVSRHEANELRTDHQYQYYFSKLRSRIGYLRLSRVLPGQDDVPLERVYIPLPIDHTLDIEVQGYKIIDWWIAKQHTDDGDQKLQERLTVKDLFGNKADIAALDIRIGQIQDKIDIGADSEFENPEDRPIIFAPPWYDGIKPSFWPLSAIDAAATTDRLVLLGAPGSGKTTFARHLALCLLGTHINLNEATIKDLEIWPHGAVVPIYIELRQFVGWAGFPDLGKPVLEEHFWNYIQEEILGDDLEKFSSNLRDDLIDGKAIIILDGLDEIPIPLKEGALEARRRQLKELARVLDTTYPRCRILITSRPYGYQGWELDEFEAVSLSSLNLKQMLKLAFNLYRARNLKLDDARTKAEALMTALENVPGALKDYPYPLFLTLMATLFLSGKEEGLPTQKGALYNESILLLLGRWTEPRMGEKSLAEQMGCSTDELYERLEKIAFDAHNNFSQGNSTSDTGTLDLSVILYELFQLGPETNPHTLLPYLSQQSGVLMSPAPDKYQFAHRSFQEYLAASFMVRSGDYTVVKRVIEETPLVWREPCLLVGDVLEVLNEQKKLSENEKLGQFWDLLDALIDNHADNFNFPAESKRWWSAWLAAKLIIDQQLYKKSVTRRNSTIFESLRKWFKSLLVVTDALLPPERADIGKCLGLLGDDRPGIGTLDGAPKISWCQIPAGTFQLGTTKEQIIEMSTQEWAKGWTFNRETPYSNLSLPEFYISRYPITNLQFNTFVNDPDGYQNLFWWTDEGKAWIKTVNGPITTELADLPNYPRTAVSWYEAIAFCNWLSDKLGYKVRLPTEAEWEKAARGVDGRLFAWGNEFDPQKCNMNQTGIGQPSAVGCFLMPNPPWGDQSPIDMCGNIWEWCSTICEEVGSKPITYPYKNDERENLELGEDYLRVVRGGCYLNPPFLVRVSFRGRDKPTSRYLRQGFRIVCNHPKE